VSICGANLEDKILSLDVAKLPQSFAKFVAKDLRVRACQHERADARQPCLLRTRRERPRRRAAQECDEVAPSHAEKAYQTAALCVTAKLARQ